MPTYLLTPNAADPHTGLTNSYVGWHFVSAEMGDCLNAANWLQNYQGWSYHLSADPANTQLQRLSLTKTLGNVDSPMMVTNMVTDTQWFVFDMGYVTVLNDNTVQSDYTVTIYTLPTPPPPPPPPPTPPAFGLPYGAGLTVVAAPSPLPPQPTPPMFPPPKDFR